MFLCFHYLSYGPLEASRMCAVAQYAVLEANGTGQISPSPHPSETLIQFRCLANYITMSPRESMCKIWLESIRPLQICACVKKHVFVWIFFYLRLYVLCLWLVRPSVHAFVCVCVWAWWSRQSPTGCKNGWTYHEPILRQTGQVCRGVHAVIIIIVIATTMFMVL